MTTALDILPADRALLRSVLSVEREADCPTLNSRAAMLGPMLAFS
jgi:hypothetical protein